MVVMGTLEDYDGWLVGWSLGWLVGFEPLNYLNPAHMMQIRLLLKGAVSLNSVAVYLSYPTLNCCDFPYSLLGPLPTPGQCF